MSIELTRICIMSWVWVSRSECEQFVQGCGVFKQVKKSKEILGQRTAALSEVAGGWRGCGVKNGDSLLLKR
jgi:hypothetical protein